MNRTDTTGRTSGRGTMPDDLDTLSNMSDYDLAEQMIDPRGYELCSRDGEVIGEIRDLVASPSSGQAHLAVVEARGWGNNRQFTVPLEILGVNDLEKKAYAPFVRADFETAPEFHPGDRDFSRTHSYWSGRSTAGVPRDVAATAEVGGRGVATGRRADVDAAGALGTQAAAGRQGEIRVPVMEETAEVRRELREVGQVQIRKRADVKTQHISEPVTRTRVTAEVRDVPEGAERPQEYTQLREGETLRVPVVQEELDVRKVPHRKETVIRTEQQVEQVERDVELRREHVEAETEGDVEVERTGRGR